MQSAVQFVLDGRIIRVEFAPHSRYSPTTTVLNYLRDLPNHKGVKEGCAEGDCGACTVVVGELDDDTRIRYRALDSCLLFLPMIHRKQLITVENLKSPDGVLHPVQAALVEAHGSQCGFCTPGIVMSLFGLYKHSGTPSPSQIDDALTGNLCRCTGYRPVVEAGTRACRQQGADHFTVAEPQIAERLESIPSDSLLLQGGGQTYFQVRTLEEALALVEAHAQAIVISGATDVALRVTKRHELLPVIIDVSTVAELKRVSRDAAGLSIGAGVVLSDAGILIGDAHPSLADALAVFGSRQIRNLATLGGNIGTASPIGDMLSALMPLNASVVLQSVRGRREVPLDAYVVGYRKTVRKPDELIVSVRIPSPQPGARVKWYKVSKRKDLDISTVSAGFRLETGGTGSIENVKLVYGGMAEMVKRAKTAEAFLCGRRWCRETVEAAMPLIDADFMPISDARGSAEFRRVVARNLLLKFWNDTQGQ